MIWTKKHVDETDDRGIDWAGRLSGDTLSSVNFQVLNADSGVEIATSGFTGAIARAWFTGGVAGREAKIQVTAITTGGRTLVEIVTLPVWA